MSSILALCGVTVVFCVLLLVRNELVFRIRARRLSEIHDLNVQQIGRPDFIAVMEQRYAELDSPGYADMVLDLRRWTYRQFFPQEVA